MKEMNVMNEMKVKNVIQTTLATTALAAGLAGCSTTSNLGGSGGSGADAVDGRPCGPSVASGRVYIDVNYADDGTPLDPGECRVTSGTFVTWRGPDGEPVVFEIRFKATAPLARAEGYVLSSAKTGERHKLMRQISGPPARYEYAIKANGKELDPVIIIK